MADVIRVYLIDDKRVYEHEVKRIIYDLGHIAVSGEAFGENAFLTREEAEAAIAVRRKDKEAER